MVPSPILIVAPSAIISKEMRFSMWQFFCISTELLLPVIEISRGNGLSPESMKILFPRPNTWILAAGGRLKTTVLPFLIENLAWRSSVRCVIFLGIIVLKSFRVSDFGIRNMKFLAAFNKAIKNKFIFMFAPCKRWVVRETRKFRIFVHSLDFLPRVIWPDRFHLEQRFPSRRWNLLRY